jgi:putative SOS response-associated peptidase YedK
MCGRFTLHHTTEEIAQRFAVQQVLFEMPPRYNIAPSQPVAAVIQQDGARRLEGLRWGLVPFWAKDPEIGNRLINARAETLAEKPAFRQALARRRCLIPADGFYEWKQEATGRQPMHIRMNDGRLFAFAGLWEEWKPPADALRDATLEESLHDGVLRTCTIVTTDPNALLATMHHRMAVILRPEDEAAWLDPSLQDVPRLLDLLRPYPDQAMEAYAISKRVNAPTFDDPVCIAPLAEEAIDGGQRSLW